MLMVVFLLILASSHNAVYMYIVDIFKTNVSPKLRSYVYP